MAYEFDRYRDGQLMAEGIQIARAKSLADATARAAQLADQDDVLALRLPYDERIRALESENASLKAEREAMRGLLREAACSSTGCDGEQYPVPDGRGDWTGEQCQWCYERRALLAEQGGKR